MLARNFLSSEHNHNLNTFYKRFALYYIPSPDSELADFAQNWFGFDFYEHNKITQRDTYGLDSQFLSFVTDKPKRYGLHATLKAPFYLNSTASVDKLQERLEIFCANRKRLEIGPLTLGQHGDALALTLKNASPEIDHLASQCVLAFDEFRAPLSVSERTHRLSSSLTTHQRLMLETYGYPYVLSEFNFHITLTSPLEEADRQSVIVALKPIINTITQSNLVIDSIALVGDPGGDLPFEIVNTFHLNG